MVDEVRRAALAALGALALLALTGAPVGADYPALSREFMTESYARDSGSIAALRDTRGIVATVALAWLSRALVPGAADPRVGHGELGGRASFGWLVGRNTLGADATLDGDFNVDSREYPARFHAAAVFPEAALSIRGVLGFGEHEVAGGDLEIEGAPLPLAVPVMHADLRPELWGWLRVRRLAGEEKTLLTPAAALAIQHLPVLASALALALSAQVDLAERQVPASFGMVQIRWISDPAESAGEPTLLGAQDSRPSSLIRRWYAYGAYAFPLDDRHLGRLAVGVGLRLATDLGW